MDYSQSGVKMTEQFEGCKLCAYQDQVGVWTIGYGHTLGVQPGQCITLLQAETFLLQDMNRAVKYVNMLVKVTITQGEFDALVDFAFNVGCGALAGSTLLKLLNHGDYAGAAAEFDKWDHAAGQVVAGLLRRRQAETAEFQGVQA